MLNIFLKVNIEKKWPAQNVDFVSLKSLSPSQFFESTNSCRFHSTLKHVT